MKFTKLLIIATLTIAFSGSAFAKDDSRTPINLSKDERNLVLSEMRALLDTVRSITVSMGKEDMEKVAKSAKKMGMAASGEVPPELTAKLPMQFRMLAMKVHKGFDQIALDATEMGDNQQTLEQLGELMGNCVACHAIYKFPAPK
jgi:mono/diheme cytochrome c family protein